MVLNFTSHTTVMITELANEQMYNGTSYCTMQIGIFVNMTLSTAFTVAVT